MDEINELINEVNSKTFYKRFLLFLISVFLLALNYNLFILPNNFNIGGTSGLAIIFNELCGINESMFILIANVLLLVISFCTLGKKQTLKTVVGSLLYPVLIMATKPIADYLIGYFQFSNILITIILAAILLGVSNGLIFKSGFTTGGGDVVMKIISKYNSITEGNAQAIEKITTVLLGGLVFGVSSVVYSIIIIMISTALVDKILIGISDSKMFFIYSKKVEEIKKYALEEMKCGATIFNTEGGFMQKKRKMLMVVVNTKEYYAFKSDILAIDPEAFFVISDCYEVSGGYKKNLDYFDM